MSILSDQPSGIQEYKLRTEYSIRIQYVRSGSGRLDRDNVSYHSGFLRPRGYPGEAIELGLIACSQLTVHRCQSRLLFRKLLIEIAGIRTSILPVASLTTDGDIKRYGTYDSREVRRGNALVENVVEINVLEERMLLDLFRIALT